MNVYECTFPDHLEWSFTSYIKVSNKKWFINKENEICHCHNLFCKFKQIMTMTIEFYMPGILINLLIFKK